MERCCDNSASTSSAALMELSALALQLAGLDKHKALGDNVECDQQSAACCSVISTEASTSASAFSISSSFSSSSSSQRWSAEERCALRFAIDQCNTRRVPWKQIAAKTFSHSRSNAHLRAMKNYMRGKITKQHDTLTTATKRIYYCSKCKQPKRSPHLCEFVV